MITMLLWGCQGPATTTTSTTATPMPAPTPTPVPTPIPTPPTEPIPTPLQDEGRVVFWGTETGSEPALHLVDRNGTIETIAAVHQIDRMLAGPSGAVLAFTGRLTDAETTSSLYTVVLEPQRTPVLAMAVPTDAELQGFSDDGNRVLWREPHGTSFGVYDRASGVGVTHDGPHDVCTFACVGPILQPGSGDWWAARIDNRVVTARWDGTDRREVPRLGGDPFAWAADGSRLVLAGEGHLLSTRPDGTDPVEIALPTVYDTPPASALLQAQPSGDRVTFTADGRGSSELWSAPVDAVDAVLLSPPHPEYATDIWFDGSPSGHSVLYASSMDQVPLDYPPRMAFYVTGPDFPGALHVGQVTTGWDVPRRSAWNPQETHVLITTEDSDSFRDHYQLVDLQNGDLVWTDFANTPRRRTQRWSPDGGAVLVDDRIVTMTGQVATLSGLVENPGPLNRHWESPAAWLADSSSLVVQLGGVLALVSPDGTSTTLVGPGFEPLPAYQWQVLDRPAPPASPYVPDVTDLSVSTFQVPDPVPASHRYLTAATGTTYTALQVGGAGFCALQSDGVPTCEVGAATPPAGEVLSAITVGGTPNAPLVCGVRQADATLQCWGEVPAGVPTDATAVDVAADEDTVCAIGLDGALTCWGDTAISETGPFTAVEIGGMGVAARRVDGTLWWNAADASALGSSFTDFLVSSRLCVLEAPTVTCQYPSGFVGPLSEPTTAIGGRFSDYGRIVGGAIRADYDGSNEERVVASTPPTGLRFEAVDVGFDWVCGIVEGGGMVFCHDSYHTPIYPP